MMPRGHMLYFILLPVLAQVAADETDEQIMSEVMSGEQDRASSRANALLRSPPHMALPNSPLPPALLLQLLQSSSPLSSSSSSAAESLSSSLHSESSGEVDDNGEVTKRVFCNGFTGCGGRHRDRSRRQERYGKRLIPLLVKRPFCNSFGCYNGKRSSALSLVNPGENYRARVLAHMLAASKTARHQTQEEGMGVERSAITGGVLGKRLFCNGYGGCRGGKRSLFSPWVNKMNGVVGEGRR